MEYSIIVNDVSKAFRGEMVLKNVSVKCRPGYIYGFVGKNGSGFENLRYLASIKHKIDKEKIRETMAMVGLDWRMKKWVGHYSLGMRQRLGIAQAIMEDPNIIILDEPMNGLDKAGVESMRELFLKLRDQGKTILLASHNEDDIHILCDEIHRLDGGSIIE